MGINDINDINGINNNSLYTIEEAAKFLDVTVRTITNLVYIDKLKPVNKDQVPIKNWLFSQESLEKRKQTAKDNKSTGSPWRTAGTRFRSKS